MPDFRELILFLTPFTKFETIFVTPFFKEVQADEAADFVEFQIFCMPVLRFVNHFLTPSTSDVAIFTTDVFKEFQIFFVDDEMEFQVFTVQVFTEFQRFLNVSGRDLNQSTIASHAFLTAEAALLTMFLNVSDSL